MVQNATTNTNFVDFCSGETFTDINVEPSAAETLEKGKFSLGNF